MAALVFLDLDNFKNVNDSRGHGAGDRLLQAAAQRLVMSTRESDTVARLGGDEFAILLEGITHPVDAEEIAAKIIDVFKAPLALDGNDIVTTTSIGIAYSEPHDDTERLLRNADIAMYRAKGAGKGRFVVFQQPMQEQLHERLRLVQDIDRAIDRNEFFLEFQPVVDLATRELLGVEALVRWQRAERGLLMPGEFIAVAEESGQIVELGKWVLADACRRICEWSGARWMLENPVSTISTYWRKPDYTFHPYEYGDPYLKKTCLWVGGGFVMPQKAPVEPTEGQKIWKMPPSKDRGRLRSKTPAGFAKAVYQWNGKLKEIQEKTAGLLLG